MQLRVLRLVSLLLVATVACDDGPTRPPGGGPVADSISLSLNTVGPTLVIGETTQLTARVVDALGRPVEGVRFDWSSSSPAVARVDSSGAVTALSGGMARIRVTARGRVAETGLVIAPMRVAGGPALRAVTSGGGHTCGLDEEGRAFCWGYNGHGQLGDDTRENHASPVAVQGELRFRQLTAGGNHTCGVTEAGAAFCWGSNTRGQVGADSVAIRLVPVAVAGELVLRDLAAGWQHTCGISAAGHVYCWGAGERGQGGYGSRPTRVGRDSTQTFAQVTTGDLHTCALANDGSAHCWGDNARGQLGLGSGGRSCGYPSPAGCRYGEVVGDLRFRRLAAGGGHTCGLTETGEAYCWGSIADLAGPEPLPVGGVPALDVITAGSSHSCGLTREGTTFCWGWNNLAQLGSPRTDERCGAGGAFECSTTPRPLAGDELLLTVDAGAVHTCGTSAAGVVVCWGGPNSYGELGRSPP